MDTKKLNFIIKHFGCYTTKDGKQVLTSLANASRVPVEEFWNEFSGDAENYFEIRETEDKRELSLIMDDRIIKHIEREFEYEKIAKLNVGFGWEWINKKYVRCYFEDEAHHRMTIPFLFAFDYVDLQSRSFSILLHHELDTAIFDEAKLAPVNSGATEIKWAYLGDSAYTLKGGKYGCLNKIGKVQIPLIYDECIWFTNPHTAIAQKDGKKYLINKWGECLNHSYDELVRFYGDFCVVKQNMKLGIIDYELNEIIPTEYDDILCKNISICGIPMFNTVTLYVGSHCGLFDLDEKKFIVDIAYDAIVEHRENKSVFSVCINNKWGLIDSNSFVIVPIEYEYIAGIDHEGLVFKNGKYGIVNYILSSDSYSSQWKDITFNELIPCVYDEVLNTEGKVTHTQSLFLRYRCYFAQNQGDKTRIDCYYKLYHRNNGCTDYFTYELLTSLYCDKKDVKNTIVAFDAMQKNERTFSDER